jgi:hypothetical protein
MVTLGFDVSTTTVGWATARDSKIVDAGFVDVSKIDSLKEKVLEVIPNIRLCDYPDHINIEAPLLGFGGGASSQQTMIKLVRFNAIFEFMISERYNKSKTHLVNVNTVRKQVFGKAREKGVKSKDFVKQKLEETIDTSPWVKLNKRGNWDVKNGDMYDAIVLAMYKNEE